VKDLPDETLANAFEKTEGTSGLGTLNRFHLKNDFMMD
jgi:hypothetical protein